MRAHCLSTVMRRPTDRDERSRGLQHAMPNTPFMNRTTLFRALGCVCPPTSLPATSGGIGTGPDPRRLHAGAAIKGLLLACGMAMLAGSVHAGSDLDALKKRDVVRCGVSDGIAGFSERDAAGRWRGMNVDFCRAVAAAALGSPDKVQFIPLKASERFPALLAKKVDLLLRNTSWTMTREALLKLRFPAVLFYDGQGFMVAKSSGVRHLSDLAGATICVEKGTTHERRLPEYFRLRGMTVQPLVIDSAREVATAFLAGRCQAYSSDASQLAATRARAPTGKREYVILPERISKEPLAAVVRDGDREWEMLVRWVFHALVGAEEVGVTRANADASGLQSRSTSWGLISGNDTRIAQALGVPGDWALRAVRAVGNYGEVYERNLGAASDLGIERGPNRIWTQGGLHYAPPLE